ncbi:hypothetical protein [Bradyrhizobium sp.]|jgi:hypothetical protein|uniref:hypothetical protein n=1 Tax=Bradyrhizobium sp. TaxID=376 RepID=UPI003D13F32D
MAEAIQLKVDDIFERKGNDGVLIKYPVAAMTHLVRLVPGMNDEHARGPTAQIKAHDLRTMKTWNLTEPRDEIGAARDAGVDCLDFVHVPQENNPACLVKQVRFRWLAKRRQARFLDAPSQIPLSSPAKAGDPVNAGVTIPMNLAEYWMSRFRGA